MANFMTLLRVLLVIPIAVSILKGSSTAALLLTLLGALTDLVDGKVARKNGGGNQLGKLLDPFADKIFVLSILIALVEVGLVSSIPVILLLLRELSVSFFRSLLAVQGVVLGASQLGKVKTLVEFLALIALIGGSQLGHYLLWTAVGLAYVSFYDYVKTYLKKPLQA
ncbi:CDP-diacylglycerol--glycerol-3-phosphate 3-phosphatidyltransferase [Hydrogenivirga caldilitoris]|uniref:CDP-diacylglycerol--glycerol-3-phosphate 3-phosphatidyltransferase n=1 Tax=Hydrogenivirga caldilitoris TaxID=246264 RepID=A0A497XQX2_9AQUI|nr:CDP-alcohol phosphatidyltransferase family protein [Hydrogenivirga caldilitoris]RLJ71365.1 CDP-diacylglycerol--glycerol-3-phosphate 3-phosphatidyltransferase [Hydrogenivirga caldilitoris]